MKAINRSSSNNSNNIRLIYSWQFMTKFLPWQGLRAMHASAWTHCGMQPARSHCLHNVLLRLGWGRAGIAPSCPGAGWWLTMWFPCLDPLSPSPHAAWPEGSKSKITEHETNFSWTLLWPPARTLGVPVLVKFLCMSLSNHCTVTLPLPVLVLDDKSWVKSGEWANMVEKRNRGWKGTGG